MIIAKCASLQYTGKFSNHDKTGARMFIVWGKKYVYRKVGHVADFCPICRRARCFELKRVGLAGHVYYITAGQGELVGYERTCASCAIAFDANPNQYASHARRPSALAALQRETFPDFEQVRAERLALEAQIRHDPASLSAKERYLLIRSPFLLLSPKVEKRFASTHMDKEVGFALVGAVLLMMLASVLAHAVAPDAEPLVVLGSAVAGVVLIIWQIAMAGRRYMRRQIIPVLAGTLQPLRPAHDEIERAMAELKQLSHKIGSKFKPAELLAHMQAGKA